MLRKHSTRRNPALDKVDAEFQKQQFKQELRSLPIKELTDKIEYYSGFKPRGLNYQNMLDLHEAELERRFLAWEVCEV